MRNFIQVDSINIIKHNRKIFIMKKLANPPQKRGEKREILTKHPFKEACPFKTGNFSTPLHLFGAIPSSIV
jgi:hypothetical protein